MMLAIFGNDFVSAFQADAYCVSRYQPPGAARGFVVSGFQPVNVTAIISQGR